MDVGFHVYRDVKRLTKELVTTSTCYYDEFTATTTTYKVIPLSPEKVPLKPEGSYILAAHASVGYLNIMLDKPEEG